jgi:hypothetical protein
LRLCEHLTFIAVDLAFLSDGVSIESKSAMIAMTTSSSTRLKPGREIAGVTREREKKAVKVLSSSSILI